MTMEAKQEAACFSTQSGLFDGLAPDSASSKTSSESIAATKAETLLPWLEKYLGASSTFQKVDGKMPALLLAKSGFSNGQLWMRNTSEWRSGAVVCSLSQILETGAVAPRYFLSATACRGILRRAEKRGKTLPAPLEAALRQVADSLPTSKRMEDCKR